MGNWSVGALVAMSEEMRRGAGEAGALIELGLRGCERDRGNVCVLSCGSLSDLTVTTTLPPALTLCRWPR
jgi:hypothetical protein